MESLPLHIRRAVRRYEPVKTDGLTLWPVRVAEYEEFMIAQPAVDAVQQSFPAKWMAVPLLQAFFSMELEARQAGEPPVGLFYRACLFLALAMRLGEGQEAEARVERFTPMVDPERPDKLVCLRWTGEDGEEGQITPVQFQRLRPILAAQNGIELASETANPELLAADRDLKEMGGPNLKMSLDDLVGAMAALSGQDEGDVEDWPIRKMNSRRRVYDRVLGYLICGIGEAGGAKFKHGNPYPSPYFDRDEGLGTLKPLEGFAGGQGVSAVRNGILAAETPQQEKE